MIVILVLSVGFVIIGGFFWIKHLDRFFEDSQMNRFANQINIAFENPIVADSFCEKLENFSSNHPNVEFCFFTGTIEEIENAIDMGKISFGIVSSYRQEKYNTVPITLKSGTITLPFHAASVKPFSESVFHGTVIFCEDKSDGMKRTITDLFLEVFES